MRIGDTVRIVNGSDAGKLGEITAMDLPRSLVFVVVPKLDDPWSMTEQLLLGRSDVESLEASEHELLERLANLLCDDEDDVPGDEWDVLPAGTDEQEWSTYALRLCQMEDR